MKGDFKGRDFIVEMEAEARRLRAEARGFAGLANPFSSIQQKMLLDFQDSGAMIKHPGDKGTAREDLLRSFLTDKGYLPARFGVSNGSSHIISSDGAQSNQIDLLIYDAPNTPQLFSMGNVRYFPVECVHGVFEVKSDLNSEELVVDGLNKIASFKRLRSSSSAGGNHGLPFTMPVTPGFGILFAYDATLKWNTLFKAVESWQQSYPSSVWPNMVVVLNQGLLLQLKDNGSVLHSTEIQTLTVPHLMPVPGDDANLLRFYLLLMDLLNSMHLARVPMRQYAVLPAQAEGHRVEFTRGPFSEVGRCEHHGSFLRQMSVGSVSKLVALDIKPIDGNEATRAAYGNLVTGDTLSRRLYDVRIYNPENLPLGDILVIDSVFPIPQDGKLTITKSLAYEEVAIDGLPYWLPFYYDVKEGLIASCPKCNREPAAGIAIEEWKEYHRQEAEERASRNGAREPPSN